MSYTNPYNNSIRLQISPCAQWCWVIFFFPKVIQVLPILEEMLECFNAFKFFKMRFVCYTHTHTHTQKYSPNNKELLWPIMPGFNYLSSLCICFSAVKPKPFQQAESAWWGRCLPILSSILFPPTQHRFNANQTRRAYIASTDILTLHAPGSQLSCRGCSWTGLFPLVVITLGSLQ